MGYRIGIDLGGTNIAGGVVDETYHILYKDSIATKAQGTGEELLEDIVRFVHRLLKGTGMILSDIRQIGIGVPGTANKSTGVVEYANNLKSSDLPIIATLEERLGRPIFIENDANAAALGEYLVGNVKSISSFLMVTLGTGIGGGAILNGRLLEGCNYAAAEFGHMVIEKDGRQCTCGRKGCFEAYASVTALITMARELVKDNPNSLLYKVYKENHENLNGQMICNCVRSGDEISIKVLNQYINYLAIGLTNLVNIFQPEVLCIGGGISAASDLFIDMLREQVKRESYTTNSKVQTILKKASLGNDAGIVGAAFLV